MALAIFSGTPSSSNAKLESGDTTLLAEKSTLFPIKCCLNLPYLDLSLSSILLMALRVFFFLPPPPGLAKLTLSTLTMIEATIFSISSILLLLSEA